MANINFFDQNQVPRPREEVKLEEVTLTPYPDGQRVGLRVRITPFGPTDRPNLDVLVFTSDGQTLASDLSVVETVENDFTLTIHLREPDPDGAYNVDVILYYEEGVAHDRVKQAINVSQEANSK